MIVPMIIIRRQMLDQSEHFPSVGLVQENRMGLLDE